MLTEVLKDMSDTATKERLIVLWLITPFGANVNAEELSSLLGETGSATRIRMATIVDSVSYMKQHSGIYTTSTDSKEDNAQKKTELEITRKATKRDGANILDFTDRFTPTVVSRLRDIIEGTSNMATAKSEALERAEPFSPGSDSLKSTNFSSPATSTLLRGTVLASASVRGKGKKGGEKSFFMHSSTNAQRYSGNVETDKRNEEKRLDKLFSDIFEAATNDSSGPGSKEIRGHLRSRKRFMVYVIGGLTHYEKQKMLELENDRYEILIGSDAILTASDLMTALESPSMREFV